MFLQKFRQTGAMNNTEKLVRVRVADLIRQQYRARGISKGKFAKDLGVTERTVGYWLDGTSLPKGELQTRIEEMYGWPKGGIAAAIAAGLSGTPVEDISIEQRPVSDLGGVPASVLADELLARLRAADDEVRALQGQLADARQQLEDRSQPDFSLAAHGVEDSMRERWLRDEDGVGEVP